MCFAAVELDVEVTEAVCRCQGCAGPAGAAPFGTETSALGQPPALLWHPAHQISFCSLLLE